MCGHCIVEGFLMTRLADPAYGTPAHCEPIHLNMALMHATDIRGMLTSLRHSSRESEVAPVVVLSLLLEVFLTEGFDPELAAWADSRFVGDWLDLAAGKRLPGGDTRMAAVLQSRAFWHSDEPLAALTARVEDTTRDAEAVLTAYRDWWYRGQGKVPVPTPEERMRSRGIMDPIEMTSAEDFDRLYAELPIVYLAALWLSRQPGGHPLLEELALATPPAVPDFIGPDLWLQRRCLDWVCLREGEGFVQQEIARIPWYALLEVAMRQGWDESRKLFVRESIANARCDVGVGIPEAFLEDFPAWGEAGE